MTRTITLVTAARAKGVELPGEWFYRHSPKCPKGHDIPSGRNFSSHPYKCNTCEVRLRDMDVEWEEACCAPDLTLPENLHHAFMFADALCVEHVVAEILWCPRGFQGWIRGIPGNHFGYAPERHLALVAACEAALGIERREEGV